MIKDIPAKQTSDGKLFLDEIEAMEHEYALHRESTIKWFISKQEGYTDRGKVTARRIIGDFLDSLKAESIEIPSVPADEDADPEAGK